MPGRISPIGTVFADAMAHLDQRLFDGLGHAVEHLDFVAAGAAPEGLGAGDAGGHAADVVRAERAVDLLRMLEHQGRDGLVVRVGFVLEIEDRDRPVPLPREQRFGVPISAFNQADGDPAFLRGGPLDQLAHVARGIAQVGLHRDAEVRAVREFRLGEHALEKIERHILQAVMLHVEIDEDAALLREPQDRAQALAEMLDGILRRAGMDLRIERGNFNRDVDLRDRAAASESSWATSVQVSAASASRRSGEGSGPGIARPLFR